MPAITAHPVPPLDASREAAPVRDAAMPRDATHATARDAATPLDASAVVAAPTDVCDGATPHGCYLAHADNPLGCPVQIHEQSAGYPPLAEWTGCEAPWYAPCVYTHDGQDLTCVCDLGFHWICDY